MGPVCLAMPTLAHSSHVTQARLLPDRFQPHADDVALVSIVRS